MGSMNRKLRKGRDGGQRDLKLGVADAIAELRRLVSEAANLGVVEDFFHDVLVPRDDFLALGETAQHPLLITFVRELVRITLSEQPLADNILHHIKEHSFWHGCFAPTGAVVVGFVYFEDINRGVIMADNLVSHRSHQLRFSMPPGVTDPQKLENLTLDGMSRRGPEGPSN